MILSYFPDPTFILIPYSATPPETSPNLLLSIEGEYFFVGVKEGGLYEIFDLSVFLSMSFFILGLRLKPGKRPTIRSRK
jgi:hypothetical protein